MKIIISESRIPKIVSEYIEMTYGELNQVYIEDKDIFEWYKEGEDVEETYPLFDMSANGTLYVPNTLKKTIGDLFGFETIREVDNAIKGCWKYMFGINPERVNIYFD
jgi:hypothetical protein